jgi:hypothetical protein
MDTTHWNLFIKETIGAYLEWFEFKAKFTLKISEIVSTYLICL